MKVCYKCKEEKVPEAFGRDVSRKDGLFLWCKPCANEAAKQFRLAHVERAKERDKAYYQQHAELVKRKKYEARQQSPEVSKATQKRYRQKNPARVKATQKRYRLRHPEQRKETERKSYQKHAAARRLRAKAYRLAHPAVRQQNDQRRRARKRGATICDFTQKQWIALQEHYKHRCVYCGIRQPGRLTQDHITPLSKGGNHTATNIVPACKSCNSRKNNGPVLKAIQPLLVLMKE